MSHKPYKSIKSATINSISRKPQAGKVLHRATVERPQVNAILQKAQTSGRRWSQKALVAMAIIVFVFGVGVSLIALQTNKHAKAQVSALATTTSKAGSQPTGDQPSETKPTNINDYQVAPNLPRFIRIPSLDVFARVKSLGVNSKNVIEAPDNIHDTGWYNGSAKLGDTASGGAVLIDGHVSGPTQAGVFSRIKGMKSGDIITMQRGDNQTYNYKVVKVETYDLNKLNMAVGLVSARPGEPGLNLITCSGKYARATGYPQRTIVYATLQK